MEEKEANKNFIVGFFGALFIFAIIGLCVYSATQTQTNNTLNVVTSNTAETNTRSNETNTIAEEKKIEIKVADFSKMSKKEIEEWGKKNNVKCVIKNEYSSDVKKDSFIRQSVKANEFVYEEDEIIVVFSLGKEPTLGETNALSSAKSYLNAMPFSYKGLIKQLKYEGFSEKEATYGADNCGADWDEEAAKMAKSYLETMSFSKSGLIKQLEYEGFTKSQAQYGAKAVGY